jgi:hypothetical protein
MHTLYVAGHGTAVPLGAYVTDLQHRLDVGTRRRHPMAERPTTLEITAAQEMIARFSGFEQIAAAYLAATSANPDPGESSDTRHPARNGLDCLGGPSAPHIGQQPGPG